MKRAQTLADTLRISRPIWDRPGVRAIVRREFDRVTKCGTGALGSSLYASPLEERIVHHTCKCRLCSSCGHRATKHWQRLRQARIPDVPFSEVVLTMPDRFWPIFRDNRRLHRDLPTLAALVLQKCVRGPRKIVPAIVVVLQTFSGALKFNPHLHILISRGGMCDGQWISSLNFDKERLMKLWRDILCRYLRRSLDTDLISTEVPHHLVAQMIENQSLRDWQVNIRPVGSKSQFLKYAGRYIRRPPIPQYKIEKVNRQYVSFQYRIKREQKRSKLSLKQFIYKLADQVPERYTHTMRYFGLLAPRSGLPEIFKLLGLSMQPVPTRLGFAEEIEREFGTNPLRDSAGNAMEFVRYTYGLIQEALPESPSYVADLQ